MKSHLYHLQLNIEPKNLDFYKRFFAFLGWGVIFEEKDVIGFRSETNGDLWLVKYPTKKHQDYDDLGVNHISLRVEEQNNIEEITEFLKNENIPTLFETPRHRPEFSSSESDTYYQIMFTSPDNILFEIVYIGKKK